MIIILTEDTKTGFDFLELMRNNIFITPVDVYNSSYGDKAGGGSSSKLFNALENLIKDKKINRGDVVYLAYDNIIPTKERMYADKVKFKADLAKCERRLKNLGITYYKSDYTSIEELIISFEDLLNFCSTPRRDMNDSSVKLYYIIQHYIRFDTSKLDYRLLFESRIKKGETIENCLKALLKRLTTDNEFINFRVADNSIGVCWRLDCNQVHSKLHCKTCGAVNNTRIIGREQMKYRLKYLYNHSLFKSTFKQLGIQLLI